MIKFIKYLFFLLLVNLASAQFPVLMYHAHPNLGYSDARFISHMNFLKDNGYRTVTLDQFYDWYKNYKPLPIRPLAITFDDNYIMVYTNAYPIMKERGMIFTNFVITDAVGRETSLHYCDWNEINTMQNDKVVYHESHTLTHPYLAQLSYADAKKEIENSKKSIQTNMSDKTCNFIAYPYGSYNSTVISICENAGYLLGISTISGLNYHDTPPFEIRRLAVDYDDLENFKTQIGFYNLPPSPPGKGWTIDNIDVNFYYDKTKWVSSQSPTNFYGKDFLYRPAGDGSISVKWAAYLPAEGIFNVYAWWISDSNRPTNAPYTINHLNGATKLLVNQQQNGGKWNRLGTFRFSKDLPAEVILSNDANGYVVADGIWFEPIDINTWIMY